LTSSHPRWTSHESRSTSGLRVLRGPIGSVAPEVDTSVSVSDSMSGECATRSPESTASPIHRAIRSGPHMTTSTDESTESSMSSGKERSLRIQCLPPGASTLHLSISVGEIGRRSECTCHTCTDEPGPSSSSGTLSARPIHLNPWTFGMLFAGCNCTARRASRSRTAPSTLRAVADRT